MVAFCWGPSAKPLGFTGLHHLILDRWVCLRSVHIYIYIYMCVCVHVFDVCDGNVFGFPWQMHVIRV